MKCACARTRTSFFSITTSARCPPWARPSSADKTARSLGSIRRGLETAPPVRRIPGQFRTSLDAGTALLKPPGDCSMLRLKLKLLALLAFMLLSRPTAAMDYLIDGVPLPPDAKVASMAESEPAVQRQWAGVWVGAWGGTLKHILLVESVADDGIARVVYSIGDSPFFGIRRAWSRFAATVSGRSLTIAGAGFSATYDLTDRGALSATYTRGNIRSQATMAKADFAALTKPAAVVDW